MSQDDELLTLVESARQGDADSLNLLAERIQARLYAYINRATLDRDLAQDLTQEVLIIMLRSLQDLDKPDRFLPWLYRIAQRKILEHYRSKHRKSEQAKSEFLRHTMTRRAKEADQDAAQHLMKKDLAKQTMTAMRSLQEQHRAVLSLRCFDQLPYTDIAAVMDCTEVKARVLFYRAKQALRKRLVGQGVDRYLLLTCLGVFGELTAPAEGAIASVAVTASSAKVGLLAATVAVLTSRWVLSTGSAVIVALGLVMAMNRLGPGAGEPIIRDRSDVKSMHYTMQLRDAELDPFSSLSKGAYEQWFYFPEDVDGPVFRRMQRWTPQKTRRQCAWLQNGQGNYYYASDKSTVTINNCPIAWSSLNVSTLPTDPPEFAAFLEDVQHAYDGVTFTYDPNTELLSGALDTRFADAMDFQTEYRYNTLDSGFFAYDWDAGIPVIDARDEMHQRGWTFFQVKGRVQDRAIVGQGRIPFTYNAHLEHPAWMTLTIGDTLTIADTNEGTWIGHSNDAKVASYAPRAFFCGLMRPWMGLHTLDLVRRDAAWNRRWFKTEKAQAEGHVCVSVQDDQDQPRTELVYTIDMEHDLLRRIRFIVNGKEVGQLEFNYLDKVDDANDAYVIPTTSAVLHPPSQAAPGMYWLFHLAHGISLFPK